MDFGLRAMKTNDNAEGCTRQKKSPDTQQTSYSSRAVKTDGYAEDGAGKVLACSEQTPF